MGRQTDIAVSDGPPVLVSVAETSDERVWCRSLTRGGNGLTTVCPSGAGNPSGTPTGPELQNRVNFKNLILPTIRV